MVGARLGDRQLKDGRIGRVHSLTGGARAVCVVHRRAAQIEQDEIRREDVRFTHAIAAWLRGGGVGSISRKEGNEPLNQRPLFDEHDARGAHDNPSESGRKKTTIGNGGTWSPSVSSSRQTTWTNDSVTRRRSGITHA